MPGLPHSGANPFYCLQDIHLEVCMCVETLIQMGMSKMKNTDNGFIYNGFQQTDEQSFCRTLYLKQSLHT